MDVFNAMTLEPFEMRYYRAIFMVKSYNEFENGCILMRCGAVADLMSSTLIKLYYKLESTRNLNVCQGHPY